MGPTQIILHMIWSGDLNVILNQIAAKFQYTHFVDLTKALLILQFYDVKAYL